MTGNPAAGGADLIRIEPGDRLVVLARILQEQAADADSTLRAGAANWTRLGETCLGRAIYRHRSIFQSASDTPAWSHLEFSYFRDVIPQEALQELVFGPQPAQWQVLRAEILLTTPSSFVMPRHWHGMADQPERVVSLEYIDVRAADLGRYREIMQRYVGPAAARLVEAGKIGTFRAMETAAVLYRHAALATDWNQIHLCEVAADGFAGFGEEFDAALKEIAPEGGFAGVFAGLGAMRSIPRWTFNTVVAEADLALADAGQGAA